MVPTSQHLQNFFKEVVTHRQPIIVFDIETLPDEERIKTYYTEEELSEKENMYQVSIGFHKIISFAYAVVTLDHGSLNISDVSLIFDLNNELNVLLDVAKIFETYSKYVTFNGNNYDLPVLEKRALFHGLNKSYESDEQRLALKRIVHDSQRLQNEPWNHLDLYRVLNLRGQKGGLSFMCELINEQKHDNLRGYQVQDLIKSGDIETFRQYALHDAEIEAKLFIEVVNFFRQ